MALEKMLIDGGSRLAGEIQISGAKNAALPLMTTALLGSGACHIHRVPRLKDVEFMAEILRSIGAQVQWEGDTLSIRSQENTQTEAPYEFVRKMRASVLLLGPLLARYGKARVALPGGCAIGVRPIDLHLEAFKSLGAQIELEDGYVEARAEELIGATHFFPKITVTGTINAMVAASLAKGTSIFENCALEPEVGAVAEALRKMGASIHGDGTHRITVEGKSRLNGFDVPLIPDRIETGTYMAAAALTNGDLFLRGADPSHCRAVIATLKRIGVSVEEDGTGVRVRRNGELTGTKIETAPYPGFATDMQAQFVVLLSLANGTSEVTETIFENRFMHVAELTRMGAKMHIDGSTVVVEGVAELNGAPVMATDLRASASLVLAGLAARGTTEILRIYHLDRGYEKMDDKLNAVGAKIRRVNVS